MTFREKAAQARARQKNAYLAGVDLAGFALRNKLEKVVLE